LHSQLRKRIRILSRGPNPRQRRVNDKRSKKAASRSSKSKGGSGKKKRKRTAAKCESEESAGETEDDESDYGDEWRGDEIDTDNGTNAGGSNTKARVQPTGGVRRSTRRRATSRYAPEPGSEGEEMEVEVEGVPVDSHSDAAPIQGDMRRTRAPGKRKREDV